MGNHLSRHLGWLLLAPEPKEKQRKRGTMWLFLVVCGYFAVFGGTVFFQTPPELSNALRQWAVALLLFVQALLCSPLLDGRPWAMRGARATASVGAFAVLGVFAVTFYSYGLLFETVLMAAFLVFIPCYNYSANRRRYRRSGPSEEEA